jgi:hypothetical protein
MSIHKSTLRLFKALPITVKRRAQAKKGLLGKTIRRGYIFSPEVVYNYFTVQLSEGQNYLLDMIEEIYGITAESLNSSFHKSWVKIKDTPQEELMIEQLAHYLTTYGKEAPGDYLTEKEEQFGVDRLAEKIIDLPDFESNKIKDENYIYIPKEALDIPDVNVDIQLIVIKGCMKEELKDKLLTLLASGIALKEETIQDCVEIAKFVELDDMEIVGIKNKEVKTALYDQLGLVPQNPVEFLRYVVYKATGETLLIKNKALIEKIKESDKSVANLFALYIGSSGFEKLAEIFYRFKPIFLAFKIQDGLKPLINKLRRLAVKYHKPMPEDFLNTVTAKLKESHRFDYGKLASELKRVSVFRKIRLAYALKYRTKDVDSILYRIRNGKGYATDFSFARKDYANEILKVVLNSIVRDVSKNVKGKRIYIPEHIHYSLPATEKQFTGNFPSGTYVVVPKDIIFGINWHNVPGKVVDLDLSVLSPSEGKIGWDSDYKTGTGSIMFSGDITDARNKNGATELFYVKRQKKEALILYVNYYNFSAEHEVPFKIIVAQEKPVNWKQNYMVDPNNLVAMSNSKINQKEKVLGLLVTTFDECRFYFTETYVGNAITSSNSELAEHSRKYLFGFYENTIGLKDVLIKAGAIVEDYGKKVKAFDIDLSPEALEKDTILNLLK